MCHVFQPSTELQLAQLTLHTPIGYLAGVQARYCHLTYLVTLHYLGLTVYYAHNVHTSPAGATPYLTDVRYYLQCPQISKRHHRDYLSRT